MPTDSELLKKAWQALLKNDLKTRDECCDRIKRRREAREAESTKLAEAAKPHFTEH